MTHFIKQLIISINKRESGMILVPVLIILVLVSLTIVPLMGFMNTGINAAKSQGILTQELYSAEAGVWDGVWKIQNVVAGLPIQPTDSPLQYDFPSNLNGKSLNITIRSVDLMTYKVTSTATNPNTDHHTSIETYLHIVNIAMFTQDAITSPSSVNVQPNGTIQGNVWSPTVTTKNDNIDGTINNSQVPGWPTISESSMLSTFYERQVNQSSSFSNTTIDISKSGQNGPLYVDNGNQTTSYTLTGAGALQGTIYVAGNLSFDKTPMSTSTDRPFLLKGPSLRRPKDLLPDQARSLLWDLFLFNQWFPPPALFT